jgi:hypothetical protein
MRAGTPRGKTGAKIRAKRIRREKSLKDDNSLAGLRWPLSGKTAMKK